MVVVFELNNFVPLEEFPKAAMPLIAGINEVVSVESISTLYANKIVKIIKILRWWNLGVN